MLNNFFFFFFYKNLKKKTIVLNTTPHSMKVEGTFLNINICNFKAHYVVCVQFTGFISIYPGGTVHTRVLYFYFSCNQYYLSRNCSSIFKNLTPFPVSTTTHAKDQHQFFEFHVSIHS